MDPRPKTVTWLIVLNAAFGSLMLSYTIFSAGSIVTSLPMSTMSGFSVTILPGVTLPDYAKYFVAFGAVISMGISVLMYGWLIWIAALFARTQSIAVEQINRWLLFEYYIFGVTIGMVVIIAVISSLDMMGDLGAGPFSAPSLAFFGGFQQSLCCCGLGPIIYGNYMVQIANSPEVAEFLKRAEWDGTEE